MWNCELVSVNYKTPELIKFQYRLVRKYIGNIPIRIIDGSNDRKLKQLGRGFRIDRFGYNIHHGPGAEYAVLSSKHKWVLLMDSDRWPVKKGIMDCLKVVDEDTYMVCHKHQGGPTPFTMLIRTAMYEDFPPFILHGAPFRDVFRKIWRTDKMKHFPFDRYTNNIVGGTRKKFGLGIDQHTDKNGIQASSVCKGDGECACPDLSKCKDLGECP